MTIPADDLPDTVILSDFRRLLEIGEGAETGDGMAALMELTGFIDRHGRRLLDLATIGAGEQSS